MDEISSLEVFSTSRPGLMLIWLSTIMANVLKALSRLEANFSLIRVKKEFI